VWLVEEVQEIEHAWGMAKQRQQQCSLASVLGRVVDLVEELLPEWVRPRLALEVDVCNDARELGFLQAREVI
jgi:hypothetical protein